MLRLHLVVETGVLIYLTVVHQRSWEVPTYLIDKGEPIHSFMSLERYDTPQYSMLHQPEPQPQTKIHIANRDPKFVRLVFGHDLPNSHQGEFDICIELIDNLQSGKLRPEYLTFAEFDCEAGGLYCFDLCKLGIEGATAEDGGKLYQLEK